MSEFHLAFNHLMKYEGGYVNDPDDPGGETKYGISKRSYPNLDIKNLTEEQAKSIYLREWWSPQPELAGQKSQEVANHLLAAVVHLGPSRFRKLVEAAKLAQLQSNEGISHCQPAPGPDTDRTDGERSPFPEPVFQLELPYFQVELIRHYLDLVLKRPSQAKYLKGWIRRALGA